MTSRRRLLTWLAVLATLAGCRTVPPGQPWQAPLGHDHRLVGRIWDVASERFIEPPALAARAAAARYLVLGEKHDNPDHHRLQARLLQMLVEAGRRPAVAWEMLAPSQAEALTRHLAAHPRDAVGLGEAVGWSASGWPPWAIYEPIARVALDAGLPLVPANLDRETVRAVGRQGPAALDPALVRRHGLERPLPPDVHAAMAAEIRDSHCGHAPEDRVGAMVGMQRARDAQMTEALLSAPGSDGAVLIAGAGHARVDHGVPAYLRRIEPQARVVSVAFVEVDAGHRHVEGYAERFGPRLPFDYVWFTPAVDDEDPCEKFRSSLERLRR